MLARINDFGGRCGDGATLTAPLRAPPRPSASRAGWLHSARALSIFRRRAGRPDAAHRKSPARGGAKSPQGPYGRPRESRGLGCCCQNLAHLASKPAAKTARLAVGCTACRTTEKAPPGRGFFVRRQGCQPGALVSEPADLMRRRMVGCTSDTAARTSPAGGRGKSVGLPGMVARANPHRYGCTPRQILAMRGK